MSRFRTKRSIRGRFASVPWVAAVALPLGGLLGVETVEAYRFFNDGRGDRPAVVSEHGARWSTDVWSAGETLAWTIANDPGWTSPWTDDEGAAQPPPFADPAEVAPFVARALRSWSTIPTADILWELSGVDTSLDGHSDDGRPTIFVDAEASRGSYAGLWFRRIGTTWRIINCEVPLAPFAAAELGANPWWDRTLVHEFGHCLGLHHSGALSFAWRRIDRLGSNPSWMQKADPAMSYGFYGYPPDHLLADDVIGASLLRPANGWVRRTGSIAGSVTFGDDEPAAHVQVWALPLGGEDPLRERIGTFADSHGAFRVEGLTPGNYVLWSQPLFQLDAHGFWTVSPLDLDDTLVSGLVAVRAGRLRDGLKIALRQGRVIRPSPGSMNPPGTRDRTISTTETWATPCRGVRVRAERPSSPDGPLWFAEHDSRLAGDRWIGTTLVLEWPAAGQSLFLDWVGGYRDWYWDAEEEKAIRVADLAELDGTPPSSVLDVSVTSWQIESIGSVLRHTMEIAWPESADARLRLRSEGDACEGEPLVVCDVGGCEVRTED